MSQVKLRLSSAEGYSLNDVTVRGPAASQSSSADSMRRLLGRCDRIDSLVNSPAVLKTPMALLKFEPPLVSNSTLRSSTVAPSPPRFRAHALEFSSTPSHHSDRTIAEFDTTVELGRKLQKLESEKNARISELMMQVTLLSTKVQKLENAVELAVQALDSESARSRFLEKQVSRLLKTASLKKWKTTALQRQHSRFAQQANRTILGIRECCSNAAKGFANRGLCSSLKASEKLASTEAEMISSRRELLREVFAEGESGSSVLPLASSFLHHVQQVAEQRFEVLTEFLDSAYSVKESVQQIEALCDKFQPSKNDRVPVVVPFEAQKAPIARGEDSYSRWAKWETLQDSCAASVSVVILPTLLPQLLLRKGEHAVHVAQSVSAITEVLESFFMRQPIVLQLAQLYEHVRSGLDPTVLRGGSFQDPQLSARINLSPFLCVQNIKIIRTSESSFEATEEIPQRASNNSNAVFDSPSSIHRLKQEILKLRN